MVKGHEGLEDHEEWEWGMMKGYMSHPLNLSYPPCFFIAFVFFFTFVSLRVASSLLSLSVQNPSHPHSIHQG